MKKLSVRKKILISIFAIALVVCLTFIACSDKATANLQGENMDMPKGEKLQFKYTIHVGEKDASDELKVLEMVAEVNKIFEEGKIHENRDFDLLLSLLKKRFGENITVEYGDKVTTSSVSGSGELKLKCCACWNDQTCRCSSGPCYSGSFEIAK